MCAFGGKVHRLEERSIIAHAKVPPASSMFFCMGINRLRTKTAWEEMMHENRA